jgi:hypothetical protein
MALHLTRSSRLWTLLLLGFGVLQLRPEKNATLTVSMERRDFRPLEDKNNEAFLFYIIINKKLLNKFKN